MSGFVAAFLEIRLNRSAKVCFGEQSCVTACGPDRVKTLEGYASEDSSLNIGRVRDDVELPILADRSQNRPSLGPHCFHQNPGSENLDHSLEVIGKHVETHLRTDFFQSRREEMRAAHP